MTWVAAVGSLWLSAEHRRNSAGYYCACVAISLLKQNFCPEYCQKVTQTALYKNCENYTPLSPPQHIKKFWDTFCSCEVNYLQHSCSSPYRSCRIVYGIWWWVAWLLSSLRYSCFAYWCDRQSKSVFCGVVQSSPRLYRRLDRWKPADVSEEYVSSAFRTE